MDIGDYRHIIVTYTWETPNEGQARFVLEEPSHRTPLVVNKADNYDMINDLRGGKNQRKKYFNYMARSVIVLMYMYLGLVFLNYAEDRYVIGDFLIHI